MFNRVFRHLFTTQSSVRRLFSQETLAAIETTIASGETLHRAEIRVIIEASLSFSHVFSRITSKQRALELFGRYGIWDTEENLGLLLYINLADRQVRIIADRGIISKILNCEWKRICQALAEQFAKGNFQESTLATLAEINAMLQKEFPQTTPQENQIPDAPVIL